jgi:hypothetical protein
VREDAGVREWTSKVKSPFHGDGQFWTSVGRSADAFWTLLAATALVAAFGRFAAIAFCLPAGLLVLSGLAARTSTVNTRPLFPSREEWRTAERQAVAAAIPGALVRHLRPSRGDRQPT